MTQSSAGVFHVKQFVSFGARQRLQIKQFEAGASGATL
jgi:hypothetical protein